MDFATAKVAIILWKQVVAVGFLCGKMQIDFMWQAVRIRLIRTTILNAPLPHWTYCRTNLSAYSAQSLTFTHYKKQGSDETRSFHRCLAMSSYGVNP